MGVYTQIFATIGDTARLERTVNRYKWLLRRLEARRDIWAVFPPAWHVPQLLCIMFANITKSALAEILDTKVCVCVCVVVVVCGGGGRGRCVGRGRWWRAVRVGSVECRILVP